MANLGGGAEAHARFKQYEYRANSSLVLTTASRPRDTHEPTGEPETLRGRIDKRNFGDRAVQAKPPELQERLTKSRKKKDRDAADPDDLPRRDAKRRRRAAAAHSVLSLTDDVIYKPQTKETRAAYEALLSVIQQQFGGQPLDVLGGAADEVLTVLKNDGRVGVAVGTCVRLGGLASGRGRGRTSRRRRGMEIQRGHGRSSGPAAWPGGGGASGSAAAR